jgi:hypothetical protein
MGCGFNDIYVLGPERSAVAAGRFLDTFVPDREPSAVEYLFPERADVPDVTLRDPIEAIRHAARRPGEEQRFYFRNAGTGEPAHAMVFFTSDGGMVLGVSVPEQHEDPHREEAEIAGWLARLQQATGAAVGYALYESPPPGNTVAEFVGGLAVAWPPKLIDGRLVLPGPGEPVGVVWLDGSR